MKTLIVLCLLILVPLRAFAFCDDWRWTDTALLVTSLSLTEIDREQTIWAARDPSHSEINPFLSSHPSQSELNTKIALAAAAATTVSCLLDNPERVFWFAAWIALEAIAISATTDSTHAPVTFLGLSIQW